MPYERRPKTWDESFIDAFEKSYNNSARQQAALESLKESEGITGEETPWWKVVGMGALGGATNTNILGAYAKGQSNRAINIQRQIRLDTDMYKKGFDRIEDPDEMKQILQEQAVKGYSVAGGGAVGLPVGGTAKNGIYYDAKGNEVGSYLEGSENSMPVKNIVGQIGNKVIKVGNLMYRARDEKVANNISGTVDELNKQYSQGGSWQPSTTTPSGRTSYRFTPIPKGTGFDQTTNALLTNQPLPQKSMTPPPPANITPELKSVRDMVSNAIAQNASLEEIISGLQEEGFTNPTDFQDLLFPLFLKRQEFKTQRTTQPILTPTMNRR